MLSIPLGPVALPVAPVLMLLAMRIASSLASRWAPGAGDKSHAGQAVLNAALVGLLSPSRAPDLEPVLGACAGALDCLSTSQKSLPAFNSVSKPSTPNIAAAMPWTSFMGTMRDTLLPRRTAGTLASIMPSVVPAITA